MQNNLIKRDVILLNKDFIKELDEDSLNELKEVLDFDIDKGRIALSTHRKKGKIQCVKLFTKSAAKSVYSAPYSYSLNRFMVKMFPDRYPSYVQYVHTDLFEAKKLIDCEDAYKELIGKVKTEIGKW